MSDTISKLSIEDHIAALYQRVSRLETGGRPAVGISQEGSGSFTLNAGESALIDIDLSWTNANIEQNPHGTLYHSIFIDADNESDNFWQVGSNVDEDDHVIWWRNDWVRLVNNDFKTTESQIYIKNNDGSSHTYYLYVRFVYNSGVSGGST